MLSAVLFSIGTFCLFSAYILYGLGVRRGLVEPNRASWLIWSATTFTEALTYNAVNQGAAQNIVFFGSAIACIMVTLSVWRHSTWERPTTLESVSMAAATAAIILWLGWNEAWWAHLLMLVMIPVSFLPTLASIARNRESENSPAWGLWAIADFSLLGYVLLTTNGRGGDIPYVVCELLCHLTVWGMIGFRSLNPFRTFTVASGRIAVRTRDPATGNAFLIGRNTLGKAVYAGQAFTAGQTIVPFTGTLWDRASLPETLQDATDRYVQIERDRFLGPSGQVDDLINHSCDPNAGLQFGGTGPVLVALRPIAVGEEVQWDYSTTILDHQWSMRCKCGAAICRGVIGDARDVPDGVLARYGAAGILPPYVAEAIEDRRLANPTPAGGRADARPANSDGVALAAGV